MAVDHSLTYRNRGFINFVHRYRLNKIFNAIKRLKIRPLTHADFGCSNGYITNLVTEQLSGVNSSGFDRSENLEVAKSLYEHISFNVFDLNNVQKQSGEYDFVTCFETLEHVGDLPSAVKNVYQSCKPGGHILITVPIEIGFVGVVKYIIKRIVFRYKFELSCPETEYFKALLSGDRISKCRSLADGFSTHFGFDYRDVDNILTDEGAQFDCWNDFTTRFYVVKK